MTAKAEPPACAEAPGVRRRRLRRFAPLAVVVVGMLAVFATGAHRHVSLETLVRHRMAIDTFIEAHAIASIAAFMGLYIAVVALSIPGAVIMTVSSGILFGTLLGASIAAVSATIGATIIFMVAKSACGGNLVGRAGPLAAKLVDGFRANAFSFLLSLRLIPAIPFFVVNLVAALAGVKLSAFVAATAIGVIPATLAFSFFGSGLDSVIAAHEAVYRACLAAGRTDCTIEFNLGMIVTPQLLASLCALGLLALAPVVFKRLRERPARHRPAPLS